MKIKLLLTAIIMAIATLGAAAQQRGNGSLLQLKPEPIVSKTDSVKADTIKPKTQKASNDQIFNTPEIPPQFPGGDAAIYKYIGSHLVYPAQAAQDGAQGRVVVNFVVEKDGSISNVKVARGRHIDLDREAMRVIKSMPRWIPGKINGEPVRVTYTLPVTFRLN